MNMMKHLAIVLFFAALPTQMLHAREALAPYPEDETEQLQFLARCAGLVRAMQSGRIDIEKYGPMAPESFNAKSNLFWKVIRPRTMELFGFDPEDLTVLDENKSQMYHAFVVSSGVDQLIERGAGFYETMAQFGASGHEWGEIIPKDFETCGAAEFE